MVDRGFGGGHCWIYGSWAVWGRLSRFPRWVESMPDGCYGLSGKRKEMMKKDCLSRGTTAEPTETVSLYSTDIRFIDAWPV